MNISEFSLDASSPVGKEDIKIKKDESSKEDLPVVVVSGDGGFVSIERRPVEVIVTEKQNIDDLKSTSETSWAGWVMGGTGSVLSRLWPFSSVSTSSITTGSTITDSTTTNNYDYMMDVGYQSGSQSVAQRLESFLERNKDLELFTTERSQEVLKEVSGEWSSSTEEKQIELLKDLVNVLNLVKKDTLRDLISILEELKSQSEKRDDHGAIDNLITANSNSIDRSTFQEMVDAMIKHYYRVFLS